MALAASSQLDAKTLLRRFCFLGSLDSVYVYKTKDVDVAEFLPQVQIICKSLDDKTIVQIFEDVLREGNAFKLVRRDEPLFALATCLCSSASDPKDADRPAEPIEPSEQIEAADPAALAVPAEPVEPTEPADPAKPADPAETAKPIPADMVEQQWKASLREAFPLLIHSDNDLFLYCKYAMLIAKQQKHKGFPQTVRKAITAWYKKQPPEAIRDMWMTKRGAHGFKHADVIKLCHISDETIGAKDVVSPFFKTCTELLKIEEFQATQPATAPAQADRGGDEASQNPAPVVSQPKKSPVYLMSKLRTTTDNAEALRIIRKLRLRYCQVPSHLLKHAPIMEELIPSMTHLQLLKCWRSMARRNQLQNQKILQLVQAVLDNRRQLHQDNIHPIVFLMQLHELGIRGDLTRLANKKVEAMKMTYIQHIYTRSFGQNQGTGLRFHISLNFQTNYKKKLLRNHKKLSFYDASVALAFGYFKKEGQVDVFHWYEEKLKQQQVPWKKAMDIKDAIACCDKIHNEKNPQRLVNPLLNSLTSKQVYDVFLAIVPTAGRGNPKQNSDFLCKFLDKYREIKNPRAKYVILDLLKFRKSMSYSNIRNENILEICGLDENTTNLINNFALNRFG